MKLLCLFLIAFSISIIKPAPSVKPVNKPFADSTLIQLKAKKAAIDNYLTKHQNATMVLVKVPGKKSLVRVFGNKWPDEIEYTYNILKDKAGKIVLVSQKPESESGDWGIIYEHYFDENGNTFAFYRSEALFTDQVKGGVAGKELLRYYDPLFKAINQTNLLVDVNHKPLKAKESEFNFRDDGYNIYKSLKDCLAGYSINNIK
jgi:hypothetical protein